jgi:hypothetical protein
MKENKQHESQRGGFVLNGRELYEFREHFGGDKKLAELCNSFAKKVFEHFRNQSPNKYIARILNYLEDYYWTSSIRYSRCILWTYICRGLGTQ